MARGARRRGVSRSVVSRVELRSFEGTVYRVIGSRFLGSPLASAGSKRHGGRFNPAGEFEVLYTALSADTAFAEREGFLLTAAGIKAARAIRTGVLRKLSCALGAVLDLTDERVRQQLDVGLADILGPWLPWTVESPDESFGRSRGVAPSQTIGRAAHRSRRFEAILSPATKYPAGRCLAIFPDRLRAASSVVVDDPEGTIHGALGLKTP